MPSIIDHVKRSPLFRLFIRMSLVMLIAPACGVQSDGNGDDDEVVSSTFSDQCERVESGYGSKGKTALRVERIVSGLTVPWGIAFLSQSEFLVSERPGLVRLVRNGSLVTEPVVRIPSVASRREGGLLGIALHPQFRNNRYLYVYFTGESDGREVNRVARYKLSENWQSAIFDRIILDGIEAGVFHDGGRIRFGPDGMLYVGTGDARQPDLAQDMNSKSGKILRITPDGGVPGDNPFPANPVFILGVRNVQAFDWFSDRTLIVADHGPTGELGRSGHDEVTAVSPGDNLGWPDTWSCQSKEGITRPFLVWQDALPPGGLEYYTGKFIPEWTGSAIIASLRSENLIRVSFETLGGQVRMKSHEVYLQDTYGRLREVVQAPDGSLYVTTSNCDGRGQCGPTRDSVLRITKD